MPTPLVMSASPIRARYCSTPTALTLGISSEYGAPPSHCAVSAPASEAARIGGRAADRIDADDQLTGVEGTGDRRAECRRDRSRSAAADHQAQIVAAQIEELAEQRGDPRANLGIAGLEADRGAAAVGDQRLARHDDAVPHRQIAAAQRVRLDRVDRVRNLHPTPRPLHDAKRKPTQRRRDQCRPRADARVGRQVDIDGNSIDHHVRDLRDMRHQRHHRPGQRADHQRQRDQIELVAAQQSAQPNHDAVRSLAIGEMSDPREHRPP
ncbi:hypothetical protein ABH990_006710 [Bradyrhizobium ottawaense]